VALLKAPNKQPKTTTLQVRLEEGVRRNLDNYAAFIDASPSYVVNEALKLLFRKDAEFKRWADEHSNHDHAQQLEQRPLAGNSYERTTPENQKDASTTDTSLKVSSALDFRCEPFRLQPTADAKFAAPV
jgi:predicted transcriptional regulator